MELRGMADGARAPLVQAAQTRLDRGSATVAVALAVGFAGVCALGSLAVSQAVDRPFTFFTREPAAILDAAAYVGFLSNVTTLVGALAVAACALAWIVLGRRLRSPWLWGGVATSLIVANDFFLIDDHYLTGLGVPEAVTATIWMSFLIAYAVVFRDDLRRFGSFLIAIALLLFGTAELLDRVSQDLDAIEDGLRFMGTVSLAAFFVPAAVRSLREHVEGRPRSWSALPVVVAYGSAAVLLAFVVAAANAVDRAFTYLSREPADVLSAPAYVGFLSNVGALTWMAGAGSCLVAWLVLDRSRRSPFLWGGLLTALLLADDVFLLHDDYYPAIGVPERAANGLYVVLAFAYVIRFRRFLRDESGWLLMLALASLGTSVGLDLAFTDRDAVEDSAKFVGICVWAAFFANAAVSRLRLASAAPRGLPLTVPRRPRRPQGPWVGRVPQ